jgi:hypothetical protein
MWVMVWGITFISFISYHAQARTNFASSILYTAHARSFSLYYMYIVTIANSFVDFFWTKLAREVTDL